MGWIKSPLNKKKPPILFADGAFMDGLTPVWKAWSNATPYAGSNQSIDSNGILRMAAQNGSCCNTNIALIDLSAYAGKQLKFEYSWNGGTWTVKAFNITATTKYAFWGALTPYSGGWHWCAVFGIANDNAGTYININVSTGNYQNFDYGTAETYYNPIMRIRKIWVE